MKRSLLPLLLLLTAACAAQRNPRQRIFEADTQPVLPVSAALPATAELETKRTATAEVPTEDCQQTAMNTRQQAPQTERALPGTWEETMQLALDSLTRDSLFETSQLGLYIYDLTAERPLYAVNANQRMRPASCQKVITSVTALHHLKGDYRLLTDFRVTGKVNGRVLEGDIIVTGGTDPLVSFGELRSAASAIRNTLDIDSIAGQLLYDTTMREDAPFGWGWCWDDDYGPLSALLVDGNACFPTRWPDALRASGIRLCASSGKTPSAGAKPRSVCTISHHIDELLEPMMKQSDNIFAECLFYQTAAASGKKMAGRKEAAKKTDELAALIGLAPDQYVVADGSGLSLYNYVTAQTLVAMLGYAWRTDGIRQHLLPSLPIAGVDGTLKKRMAGTAAEGNVRAKTGTVTGVVSLAGYLTTPANHTLAFAIINQGMQSAATARNFQDKVCTLLCSPAY